MGLLELGGIGLLLYFIFGGDENKEPDIQPGPVPRPNDEAEFRKKIEGLISPQPKAERFFQIFNGGPSASEIAAQVLSAKGANSGANRVRLIKCMTQIPWNGDRYASTRETDTWGHLYDVDGRNLSAAWLPRNASAVQYMAMRELPPRTISSDGNWLGGSDTYYGLVWIPRIQVINGELVCDPLAEGPPRWLLEALS